MNTIYDLILWCGIILGSVLGIIGVSLFFERRSEKKVSDKIDLYVHVTKNASLYNINPDSIKELVALAGKWSRTRIIHTDRLILIAAGINYSDRITRKRRLTQDTRDSMQVMATLLKP